MVESVRALMAEVVDYAGLFPPAALAMGDAARRYAAALAGPDAWALGRFVVPAARLGELAAELRAMGAAPAGRRWRLSALGGAALGADVAAIRAFNERHSAPDGGAVVDAIEWRPASVDALAADARVLPHGLTGYAELPPDGDPTAAVEAARAAGVRAKVRTGGVTADAFPAPDWLAAFVVGCSRADVPFKATAGLHHPLRAERALTYATDSPRAPMFGYLNVVLAAAFARVGADSGAVAALLVEGERRAFRFDDAGVRWRDRVVGVDEIRAARERGAVAFGSCSFDEPLAGLAALALT